ncbi:MAG: PGPGW domain-containing protein [Nocardioidaceae bacterium]
MPALRKVWVTVAGWLLVLAGIAALALPGPGLLLLLAGLVILSQEYDWAGRRVEPVKERAFEAAAAGVRTWPRVVLSALGALAVVAVGVVWWLDPVIPTVWIIGPRLPLGGWSTGLGVVVSGLAALALLAYSMRRFRGEPTERPGVSSA